MTDISLEEAWRILSEDSTSALVDVRTEAEWAFVGMPELASIGKTLQRAEWTRFPGGAANPTFLDEVTAANPNREAPLLLLCRSGARSRAAADLLTDAGYTTTLNVVAGFEGDKDTAGHRGGGWKTSGLPWIQG